MAQPMFTRPHLATTTCGPTPIVALTRDNHPMPLPPNPGQGGESIDEPVGPHNDPSLIYNFNGKVARAFATGSGTDQNGNALDLTLELGYMVGEYVATSGQVFNGTFFFF